MVDKSLGNSNNVKSIFKLEQQTKQNKHICPVSENYFSKCPVMRRYYYLVEEFYVSWSWLG